MKKILDFNDLGVDVKKVVNIGGYSEIEWKCGKFLSKLTPLVIKLFKPQITIHECETYLFKSNGIYKLTLGDKK